MNHGSLFSGIGGFDLAAHYLGWTNVFHCEIDSFCRQTLKFYWPKAASHEDITQTDFTIYRGRIDVLSGGFPCQPFSLAGKRKGTEDSRHLWPEMLRAVREIAPSYIVGENVLGLLNWNAGLVFEQVCSDLESAGYEVAPVVIPAAAVNAPHGRARVWFVAQNAMHSRCVQREFSEEGAGVRQQRNIGAGDTERICGAEMAGFIADNSGKGLEGSARSRVQGRSNGFANVGNDGLTADTDSTSSQRRYSQTTQEREKQSRRIESYGKHTSWEVFPTQSPVCGGDDGLPRELDGITFSKWRNESIKAYGNAVVPQIPMRIFQTIQLIHDDNTATHRPGS